MANNQFIYLDDRFLITQYQAPLDPGLTVIIVTTTGRPQLWYCGHNHVGQGDVGRGLGMGPVALLIQVLAMAMFGGTPRMG